MKTCNTCKNYYGGVEVITPVCKRSLYETDLVSGKKIYEFCSTVRQSSDKCGPTGIWHETKPDSSIVTFVKKIFRIESI